jgi:hypothetical protein
MMAGRDRLELVQFACSPSVPLLVSLTVIAPLTPSRHRSRIDCRLYRIPKAAQFKTHRSSTLAKPLWHSTAHTCSLRMKSIWSPQLHHGRHCNMFPAEVAIACSSLQQEQQTWCRNALGAGPKSTVMFVNVASGHVTPFLDFVTAAREW